MEHWQNLSLENLIQEIEGIVYVEEWKPVVGYEGLYNVSTFGRVKAIASTFKTKKGKTYHRKTHIIKSNPDGRRGYLRAVIYKDNIGTSYSIHRLVAFAFLENPEGKREVNHKNGIKIDNKANNLEWSTGTENRLHAYHVLKVRKPLEGRFGKNHHTSKPVNQLSMNGELIKRWDSAADIQRSWIGAKAANISACCKGKLKQCKGFKWEFA